MGESVVNEIAVPKGTTLITEIWSYNRMTEIWGPDAGEFNPHRFIEHDKMGNTYVGVTSNLMTFSAGLKACIGCAFRSPHILTKFSSCASFTFYLPVRMFRWRFS